MKREPLPEFPKGHDTLTRQGATIIADHLESYWRARGYLGISAEKFEIPGMSGMYGVRSNMVGGVPPRTRGAV